MELVKDVTDSLKLFMPIIRGIIFSDYARTDAKVNADFYEQDINDALSQKLIAIDDNDFSINWNEKDLSTLKKELRKLENFLDNVSKDFTEWFEEKYSCELDLDNINFWKEVFKVNINIS